MSVSGRYTKPEERVVNGIAPPGKVLESTRPASDPDLVAEVVALRAENARLRAQHAERDDAERTHLAAYGGACARRERAEEERGALRAELAATEAEARAALDEMHRRVKAAEAERDAMRERTERNEAALRVVALWLGGPHQSSQAGDVEELARAKGDELDARRAAVQRHRAAVEREQDEATTRAELFALVPAPPIPWDAEDAALADAPTLTVREPATRAERDRDTASGLLGAALACLAAERAYHATEGRPWAERIAAKRRADEARAVLARMMGGG